MSDVKELADQVISAVKSYIAQSVSSLSTRLEEFDGRLKALPDVALLVAEEVTKAVEAIPKPVNGKDVDPQEVAKIVVQGISADSLFSAEALQELTARLQESVSNDVKSGLPLILDPVTQARFDKAIEALPKPVDGKDGRNAYDVAVSLGFDGDVYAWQESLRGEPGKSGTSITTEQVLPELRAELQKAIASIPIPKNGDPGKDSAVTVEDFRTLFEAESVKALLDFERRAQDVLLKAIDNIPRPKDGDDGLGFDDLEVIHDGERTFTLKFVRGEKVKEFAFSIPAVLERGVYRSGEKYVKGDGCTFGGSYWIAQRDTESKPETDDSWRLAVKSGRQGKSAFDVARSNGFTGSEREWVASLKGDRGDLGKPGRDLTQMLHDGTKF